MSIEFEISMDDILEFNLYHHQHSPNSRRAYLVLRFVISILMLLISLSFLIQTFVDESSMAYFLFWLILAILWIVLFPRLYQRSIKKEIAKMYNEGKNKGIICKHKLSLTPDMIINTTDFGESKTRWSSIEKIVSTDNHIFIYASAVMAFIVPRRAFSDELKYKEFIRTAKQYHEIVVAKQHVLAEN